MVYIPLSISMMLLLCLLFEKMPARANSALAFIGTISLELYMVHIHYALTYVRPYHLGYWLTALAMFVIAVPMAWLLHKIIGVLTDKVLQYI